MGKILPIILLLIGSGAGVGAGVFLRPAPVVEEMSAEEMKEEKHNETEEEKENSDVEYVKMNNQFVIPVVENGVVESMVVMALSVEVKTGHKEEVYKKEPKLRDSFLQVLFDHANVGGFRGEFTNVGNLNVIRAALRDIAIRDGGDIVSDVLILDVARQDY